jgi:hypothetical protein
MWKPAYNLTRSPQPGLTPDRRAVMRNAWRARAERNALNGLTTRGTVPKRKREQRLLLAELDALAANVALVFHEAPPAVQARLLNLELAMVAVRKKLV